MSVIERWKRVGSAPPRIFGHRGASADEPENTMRAFDRARRQGADGVELDVRTCATGEVVVIHDADLSRVAGDRARVAALSLADLRARDVGRGERVPTLDEVLAWAGASFLVNVEIKATRVAEARALAKAVAAVLARHPRAAVLASSFHPAALASLRRAAPRLPVGLLFHARQVLPLRRAWARYALRPDALHPDARLCSAARVRAWSRRHVVAVWTVDDAAQACRLAALPVDAIITNHPARLRAALGTP